jgi:hypothetical protein
MLVPHGKVFASAEHNFNAFITQRNLSSTGPGQNGNLSLNGKRLVPEIQTSSTRIKRNLFSTGKKLSAPRGSRMGSFTVHANNSHISIFQTQTLTRSWCKINRRASSFSELRIYGTRGVRPLGTKKRCSRLVFPCQYHSTNTPYSLPNDAVITARLGAF